MSTQDRISRLAQQLGERLQGASHAPEEFQRGVQQVVRGAFDRLELVSREDFDILMDVLQRTRSRVETLEKQVVALEAALDERERRTSSPSVAPTSVDNVDKTASQDAGGMASQEDAGAGEGSSVLPESSDDAKAKRVMKEEKASHDKQESADKKIADTRKSGGE